MAVIRQLLAEPICEARIAPVPHPDGEVVAFGASGGNQRFNGWPMMGTRSAPVQAGGL